jgi:CRISPR-associated protein Cas2
MKRIMTMWRNKCYFVISYDISDNKLRTKLAKLLEGYGIRVHYSVFECRLEYERYRELFYKMKEFEAKFQEDSIRIYRICKSCEQEIETIGKLRKEYEVVTEETIVI